MDIQPTYSEIVHGKDSAIHIDKTRQTTLVRTPTDSGTTNGQQQRLKIGESAQSYSIDQHKTQNNQAWSPLDNNTPPTQKTSPTNTSEGNKKPKITMPDNSPNKQSGYSYSHKNGTHTITFNHKADHHDDHEQHHPRLRIGGHHHEQNYGKTLYATTQVEAQQIVSDVHHPNRNEKITYKNNL